MEKELKNPSYTRFNISIAHMKIKTGQAKYEGKRISEIRFSSSNKIQIIPDSIVLIHKDKNGNIIKHEKIENDIEEKKGKNQASYYRKIYDPMKLPEEMTEYIYVEFMIDGVKKKIEYNLPIELAKHYTSWDILMSV